MEIHANYCATSTWNMTEILADLEIELHQIKDYYIKWDTLYLTWEDETGEEHEEEISPTYSAEDHTDWIKRGEIESEEFDEEVERRKDALYRLVKDYKKEAV